MAVLRIQLSDRMIDLEHGVVCTETDRLPLTQMESAALRHLAEHADQDVSRDALEREVWGFRAGVRSEAVPVAMRRLRKKIEPQPRTPRHLLTIPGTGWRLVVESVARAVSPDELDSAGSAQGPQTLAPRRSLPSWLDRFVGRQRELAVLRQSLVSHRLVTLLGPGGVGKTRLAAEAAQRYDGAAVFVPLAEASSLVGAVGLVRLALGLPGAGSQDARDLGALLAGLGPLLLVLDNAEHLPALAEPVSEWLADAQQLHLLVTSRRPLGLRGERRLPLAPLGASADGDAVALFVDRARAVDPWVDLDSADAQAAVSQLVALLDGLPLALELAASRIGLLTPQDLLRRAGSHRSLLRDDSREERHSSLDHALDWSWLLLEPWARQALAQLSVFEGRFDMADGEAVLDLSAFPDAPWPVDAVQYLLDHSLVTRFHGQRPPLGLLVGVRAFARQRAGPGLRAARTRHARHMATFGSRELVRARDWAPDPRAQLPARVEDLEAAVRFGLALGDVASTTLAAIALAEGRRRVGPPDEAVCLGLEVLALPGAAGADRARLRQVLAMMEHKRGRVAAALALLARGAAEDGPVPEIVAIDGLLAEARIRREVGDPKSRELAEAALQRAQALGRAVQEAEAHTVLMDLHRVAGELDQAQAHGQRALTLFRAAGLEEAEANAKLTLGSVLAGQGRLEEALDLSTSGLDLLRGGDNAVSVSIGLLNTGILHARLGQLAQARALLEEALSYARRLANRHLEAGVLGNLGELLREQGELQAANQMLVAAVAMCGDSGWLAIEAAFRGALADVLVDLGRVDDADTALRQAIAGLADSAYRTDELAARRRRCALLEAHGLPGLDEERAQVDALAALVPSAEVRDA